MNTEKINKAPELPNSTAMVVEKRGRGRPKGSKNKPKVDKNKTATV